MEVETENKVFKLGEIFRITSGGTPSRNNPAYYEGDIPWIKTGDLKVRHLYKATEFITKEGLENSSAKIFPKDTVLVAMYGATIGACSILKMDAATNQACAAFLPNENVNPEFLYFYLQSIKPKLIAQGVGGGQPNISGGILKQTKIALPEIEEQNEIVKILEQADAARQKRKQALALTEQFLQSAFLEMFGDPVRNERGWEVKKLAELGDGKNSIVDGPFGSSVNTKVDYIENGEIPVIRTKNVGTFEFFTDDLKFMSREKFETVKRSAVVPGDVILTKVGTIGNVCIFPNLFKEAVLSTTGSCRIRLAKTKTHPIYFVRYLNFYKPRMLQIASTAVQAFLNMNHIKNFDVPLPPLALQEEFAALVERVEQLRHKQRESEKELENLFGSLMGRWFG